MKKLLAAALMTAMLASLAACGKNSSAADKEYIYGKIDSVSGNDIVLLLADYNEDAESSQDSTEGSEDTTASSRSSRKSGSSDSGGRSRSFSRPENGEMPSDFDPEKFSGSMPEGFSKPENGGMPSDFDPEKFSGKKPSGSEKSEDSTGSEKSSESKSSGKPDSSKMPEGFDPEKFSGELPEGFSMPSNGEMPGGFSRSGSGDKADFSRSRDSGNSKYTLTGKQEELRIPVGTTVTTSLGVKTDFDALSAGDIIKCSIEKDSNGSDVVTEVWIMEQ